MTVTLNLQEIAARRLFLSRYHKLRKDPQYRSLSDLGFADELISEFQRLIDRHPSVVWSEWARDEWHEKLSYARYALSEQTDSDYYYIHQTSQKENI